MCSFLFSQDYFSPHNGRRLWIVVYDLLPSVASKHAPEFFEILNFLRTPATLPVEDFLISEDLLEIMDPTTVERQVKVNKADIDWRSIHESAFMELGMTWPPDMSNLSGRLTFREREAECVWAANHLFPTEEVGVWQFFDANMMWGRCFTFGGLKGKDKLSDEASEKRFEAVVSEKEEKKVSNPWRNQVPTMSGGCVVCARCLHPDGTLTNRRLHGLEAMRVQGWDLKTWHADMSPCTAPQCHTNDTLQDLAGNMWSAFQFIPIFITALSAMPWTEVMIEQKAEKERLRAEAAERAAGDEDDDEASESDGVSEAWGISD